MNRSQRIYMDTNNPDNDKHIKIRLEQDVDTIEFLSLGVSTKDIYQEFNSNYGVLVGRVIANEGVGIPNAKISIFIPLSDEDARDKDIASVYPYKTPRTKNNEGKRYNLLPRVTQKNSSGIMSPNQPFGSFPTKAEVVANEPYLNAYKKYYKYTATTNDSGDYMIFGAPTGTQIIHMSVDITDIGHLSQTPAAMVTNMGYSPNYFSENKSKIKPSTDLNDLPHIETQEITVDIVPFWGNEDEYEVGVTRQDFRIRAKLVTTFVIFGNVFTDGASSNWGSNFEGGNRFYELYRISASPDNSNLSNTSKRIGKITEKIYYYPSNILDGDISTTDPTTKMKRLDESEYSAYKRDGDFALIINCNRKKKIINEVGQFVDVPDSYDGGFYTEFKGFITLEYTLDDVPMQISTTIGSYTLKPLRMRVKIPQHAEPKLSNTRSDFTTVNDWLKQHYTFTYNKKYSIAKFNGTVYNVQDANTYIVSQNGFIDSNYDNLSERTRWDFVNKANADPNFNTGIIMQYSGDIIPNNIKLPTNSSIGVHTSFGANWLNLSVYLPQFGYVFSNAFGSGYETNSSGVINGNVGGVRISSNMTQQFYNNVITDTNEIDFAAGETDTSWFARSDLHWTDFIEVPDNDIKKFNNLTVKGFKDNYPLNIENLTKYRNGTNPPSWGGAACPLGGGKFNGDSLNTTPDLRVYFYKGFGASDCVKFLYELGIII